MKTLILPCFSRPRRLAAFIVLLIGSMTLPAKALCQTVTWTSSHPDIVSVNENTGAIEMISEPDTTTDVTITATTQQNGKTLTNVKTIQVDACTSCFSYKAPSDSQERTYCGVRLSNGQCWLDRNLAASRVAISLTDASSYGLAYPRDANVCPEGWRMPTSDDFVKMARDITGNPALTATSASLTSAVLYGSVLKIPRAGYLINSTGTGTPNNNDSVCLNITPKTQTFTGSGICASRIIHNNTSGCFSYPESVPVRCIKI